jgi:hypothetical protein
MMVDRARAALLAALLFVIAVPAGAQEATVSTATVPVVGAVGGVGGIDWRTDVTLRNDAPFDVEVVLTLPGIPGDPFFFTTIRARDAMAIPDVARSLFGVTGKLSPLRVTTLGATSVNVAAVVQGMSADGPVAPQPLVVQYGELRPMLDVLPGLSVNETFRTNIGMVNPTDEDALIVLALQLIPGRNVAIVRQSIPPRTHVQVPIRDIFPLLSDGESMTVVVEHTNPGAYVYASVIANASGNARYLGPR